MNCPVCNAEGSTVLETRNTGALVMRHRECPCGWRWNTHERLAAGTLRPTPPKKPKKPQTKQQQLLPLGADEPIPVLPVVAEKPTARENPPTVVSDSGSVCSSPEIPDLVSANYRNYNTLAPRTTATAPTTARDRKITVPVALGFFCEAWKVLYHDRYYPTPAECKHLHELLERIGPAAAELPRVFANYISDMSPFVAQDMRHSLLHFLTGKTNGFNKYRVTAPILTKHEAATLAGGEQWLAMHGEGRNGKNGTGR